MLLYSPEYRSAGQMKAERSSVIAIIERVAKNLCVLDSTTQVVLNNSHKNP
jgi:hypothetical protein